MFPAEQQASDEMEEEEAEDVGTSAGSFKKSSRRKSNTQVPLFLVLFEEVIAILS
jgi:hypothetical protein